MSQYECYEYTVLQQCAVEAQEVEELSLPLCVSWTHALGKPTPAPEQHIA